MLQPVQDGIEAGDRAEQQLRDGEWSLPFPPNQLVSGAISPAADQDWFAFTLELRRRAARDLRRHRAGGVRDHRHGHPALRRKLRRGGRVEGSGAINNCSRIDPTIDTYAQHLAPGTYYVKVTGFSSSATFNYTLLASTKAVCGDGAVEGSEQCDGTPGCAADCKLIPGCGNGLREPSEQCDGNAVSGDGCSATCQWETVAEIEPNGTVAEADAALPIITGTPGSRAPSPPPATSTPTS